MSNKNNIPQPPSVPAVPAEGPEEGTLKAEAMPEVSAVEEAPKRKLSPSEMVVYMATRLLVTRKVIDKRIHIRGDRYTSGPIAAGQEIVIKPGQTFVSLEDVRALGVTQQAVDQWLNGRGLVRRTLDTLHVKELSNAPAVLGNSTGSKDGDVALGKIYRNNPGVKWGYHPGNLASKSIGALQAMIASIDPSIIPPDSDSECIRILSQDL